MIKKIKIISFMILMISENSFSSKLNFEEAIELFPYAIDICVGGCIIPVCREELFGGEGKEIFRPNYLECYEFNGTTIESVQDLFLQYEVLKLDNKLETISKGNKVIFNDGRCYIGEILCDYKLLHNFPNRLNYVLDINGILYVSNSMHTHILNGNYVLSAGEIVFNDIGKVVYISNKSGHYKPRFAQLITMLKFLNHNNVLAPDLLVADGNSNIISNEQIIQYVSERQYPKYLSCENRFDFLLNTLEGIDLNNKKLDICARVIEVGEHYKQSLHLKYMGLTSCTTEIPHPDIYEKVVDLLDIQQRLANLSSIKREVENQQGLWHKNSSLFQYISNDIMPKNRTEEIIIVDKLIEECRKKIKIFVDEFMLP